GRRQPAPEARVDLDQHWRIALAVPAEVDLRDAVPFQFRQEVLADLLDRRRGDGLAEDARPALRGVRAQVVVGHRRARLTVIEEEGRAVVVARDALLKE